MTRICWQGPAAALMLVLAAGCGRIQEAAEVEGLITLDGKPLPDVEVMFSPDSLKGNQGNSASAYTGPDGRYTLRAKADGRGGPATGLNRVTVTDLAAIQDMTAVAVPGDTGTAQPAARPKVRRFPAAYSDLSATPLKDVEVKPGKQTLNFDVKSKEP
jgi:hypothetical protein